MTGVTSVVAMISSSASSKPSWPIELAQDLAPGALRHRLVDIVALLVDEQAVAPQGVGVGRHIGEMRLIGHDDRHQPLRLEEGHQRAGARLVAGELDDAVEQGAAAHRQRERLPLVLVDVVERVGAAEILGFAGDRVPQRPGAVAPVADQLGRGVVAAVSPRRRRSSRASTSRRRRAPARSSTRRPGFADGGG